MFVLWGVRFEIVLVEEGMWFNDEEYYFFRGLVDKIIRGIWKKKYFDSNYLLMCCIYLVLLFNC